MKGDFQTMRVSRSYREWGTRNGLSKWVKTPILLVVLDDCSLEQEVESEKKVLELTN